LSGHWGKRSRLSEKTRVGLAVGSEPARGRIDKLENLRYTRPHPS
jgi:hypothetical protein